jgi:hypothetical protein
MVSQKLDEHELKNFFSEFLRIYRDVISKEFITLADKMPLFKSIPVRVEILMDHDSNYAAILLSNNSSGIFVEKFHDPLMCVATANSRKYEYFEQGKFLYLFQVNSKRFSDWQVDKFTEDFIKYELATCGKR